MTTQKRNSHNIILPDKTLFSVFANGRQFAWLSLEEIQLRAHFRSIHVLTIHIA